MANGTLSFQLPEEQPEFDLACKAHGFFTEPLEPGRQLMEVVAMNTVELSAVGRRTLIVRFYATMTQPPAASFALVRDVESFCTGRETAAT